AGLEEERRLFYVAITRAKERLWVTYANSRYRFGSLVQNEPSRFVEEIPDEQLDRSFTGSAHRPTGPAAGFSNMLSHSFDKVPSLKRLADKLQSRPVEHTPSPNFNADNPMEMQIGMEVEHQKFGFGKITALEGGLNN